MATLTGTTIQSTYDSLLKVTDNDSITGSLKRITDGLGNNTPLYLSSSAVEIVSTLNVTSTITGSNLSGTNTGDETKASIETKLGAATSSNSGYLTSADWSTFSNKIAGSGTLNTIPKFSSSSSIGNSNITDDGTTITLGSRTNISSGALGIGIVPASNYSIRSSKVLSGSTIVLGITNDGVIQSDVTTQAHYFRSTASTLAASFTLNSLYHYRASQGTIGIGSVVNTQAGFIADNSLLGATLNVGFYGLIPSSLSNYNLYLTGTAANYLAGDVGIGVAANYVSSGPILTTTLTSGGSGYVDATYTDVAATASTGSGVGALFTVVVSGGIVTSATLTWGGANWRAGDTATISNTLLGGTGSGLVITVATVDSSRLKISNANGGDITLSRADASILVGDNIGTIKFEGNDTSTKASGIYAKISAFGAAAAGGAYLSFFTRSTVAGSSLVEAMRINSNSQLRFNGYTLSSSFSGTAAGYLAFDSSGNVLTVAAPTATISGSGTTNYVTKFTGSTSIGNSLIYDNGTNVGIGITSPFGRFHSLSTGTGSNAISGVFSDGSTNGNAITISNATGLSTISATYLSTAIDSALAFQTTTGGIQSERIRITAAGNVGIGTTSPSTTLDVNGSITSSTNVRALRFWGGPSSFTTHSAPLHIFSSTIGTGAIARFNNNESTDASTLTSMWLENYAGYRAEIAYTTHLNGSNIYINNTYSSGNILFNIASSEKARILNTGQFKLNGYTSTSSFTGTAAGYLAFDSSGNILTTAAPSAGISGSGTTNYVPKFTSSSAIGNSLIFDNGTNVGIGTSSPAYKLDVSGASRFINEVKILYSGYTTAYATSLRTSTDAAGILQLGNNLDNYILAGNTGANGYLIFKVNCSSESISSGIEAMRITSGGNVGIGTSSPSTLLQVGTNFKVTNDAVTTWGPANSMGLLSWDTNLAIIGGAANTAVQFRANNAEFMRLTTSGNVGIGTTSPATKFHVYGGNITIDNPSGTDSQIIFAKAGVSKYELYYENVGNSLFIYDRSSSAYRFFINSSGNVGIGTASPSYLLHAKGSGSYNGAILADNSSTTGAGSFQVGQNGTSKGSLSLSGTFNGDTSSDISLFADTGFGARFYTNGVNERMRITSSGNVGIGTTSPLMKLDLYGTSGLPATSGTTPTGSLRLHASNNAVLDFGVDNGTANGWIQSTDQGSLGAYYGLLLNPRGGNVGIGTISPSLPLHVYNSAAALAYFESTNANGAYTIWRNSSNNFGDVGSALGISGSGSASDFMVASRAGSMILGTSSAERMRITSAGNVGIGTTSPYAKLMLSVAASASDVHALEITNNTDASFAVYLRNNITTLSAGGAGNMVFSNSSERVRIASDGRFQVNNTGYSANCTATLRALTGTSTDKILECMTISYSSAFYVRNDGNYYFSGSNLSDARTKKDINYLEESILDKVMKLKPASFRYKENEENIKGGFIAQDIKDIFPDLVTATKSDDEMMGVDYYGVIAILTKAIQEQQVQIEELKAKLK